MLKISLLLCFACTCIIGVGAYESQDEYTVLNALPENEKITLIEESKKYNPKWEDLDTRPLPAWYDQAKIGIFIHWGVFSVPSFRSEWFWSNWKGNDSRFLDFMRKNYPPGFTYQDFAPQFTAEFFEPDKWADLFARAGAKYVVLTSKHHEGFTLFPSKRSFSWNSVDTGPHRDLVLELSRAVRAKGMKFGVYHSLYEWFNPIYLEDKKNLFATRDYPDTKLWPDIKQLVNDYEPSVIWADGDWEALDTYWNSTELLAWLYNDSPVKDEVVVNDRWGIGIPCHHGDFFNCADRYNPGLLMNHKWENCFTIDHNSWGYRRNADLTEIMSINELLREIAVTISCGGNVLANIGPTKEGTISPIFQERLTQLGYWLTINGEGIYGTSPWLHQNDTSNPKDVWYTCTKRQYNARHPTAKPQVSDDVTAIYAIVLRWPKENKLVLQDITAYLPDERSKIMLLGNNGYLKWNKENSTATTIEFPDLATVRSRHAYVLKIKPFL